MATILILDDDALTRQFVHDVVEKLYHHHAVEASNLKEGLQCVHAQPPDLIFLDQHLPDGTATEFCQLLAQVRSTPEIPIWLITGEKPLSWDPESWRKLGVRGFLVKPFHIEYLHEVIEQCLQKSHA